MDVFPFPVNSCTDVPDSDHAFSFDRLTYQSPKDKPWDVQRSYAQDVQNIYQNSQEFLKYADRISACSSLLFFARDVDFSTGETSLLLKQARFCRVRHCPVCQWRRSLMWRARFYSAIPKIIDNFPKSKWLFLTLTLENPPVEELSKTLDLMNLAYSRLKKRVEFASVQGWIKTTELTRSKDGTAHPHFHCLLLVNPSYFSTGYVKFDDWRKAWAESLRVDYGPIVNIKRVYDKKTGRAVNTEDSILMKKAVYETLKYAVKPVQMVLYPEWFLEVTRQVHKRRFIASGGCLKNVLRENDETDDDLILKSDDATTDDSSPLVAFSWRPSQRAYLHNPKLDLEAKQILKETTQKLTASENTVSMMKEINKKLHRQIDRANYQRTI